MIVLGGEHDYQNKISMILSTVEKYNSADGKLIKSLQNMTIARLVNWNKICILIPSIAEKQLEAKF